VHVTGYSGRGIIMMRSRNGLYMVFLLKEFT
jgi:hypothetical protein